jgi:putative PIN family toxin of toxin-antitoxin system
MRLVLDTNVVVSGLLWQGPPARLIDAAVAGRVACFTSLDLVMELRRVLALPKLDRAVRATKVELDELVVRYLRLATVIEAPLLGPATASDPDDEIVLACAAAASADAIVTADQALLNLGRSHSAVIISPATATESVQMD